MSSAHDSPIGLTGVLTVPSRGPEGPGEVALHIRGGTETYLARSERPLLRGVRVVVISVLGPRSVVVHPLDDVDHDDVEVDSSLDLSEGN